jgi:Protein of unknown function (DUF4232)
MVACTPTAEVQMRTTISFKTRRSAARVLALGGSALLLAFAAAPAHAAVPACKTTHLVVWLNTQANGAAGTIFYTLNFTNIGPKCTLRGYPGVSAVGGGGKPLGSAAVRSSVKPVKTVTLNTPSASHGTFSTAHDLLGIVEVGDFPNSTCSPIIASGLRVYPPNQSLAAFVAFPFGACSRSGPKYLKVAALTT